MGCPSNQVQGGTRFDDVWNPVSDANNMWIFAGNVRWPACAGHHEINGGVYGNPGWGPTTTSLYFRKQLACCADASSAPEQPKGAGRRLELAGRRFEPSTIAGDAQSVLDEEEERTPSDRS